MATSSISADVKAANSKLAQYLRRLEEEQGLGVGKRKAKKLQEEKLPGGRGRWKLEPDYKSPSPMVDRPRTVDGATSFHFSYFPISKSGSPTVGGKPIDGRFGAAKNPALDHSIYIERDGAAEQSAGLDHAAYIERDGVVETRPSNPSQDAPGQELDRLFSEAPIDAAADFLGEQEQSADRVPSTFSNISSDQFERQEFWRAVERIEREPKTHSLFMNTNANPAWLAALATDERFDPAFRNYAATTLEAARQHAERFAVGHTSDPFSPRPFTVSAEQAGSLLSLAQQLPGYDHYNQPIHFQSGRGGRIQIRLVAELPHEVSASDRALIAQNFCDHLATLTGRKNEAGEPYRTGFMYTAVIHAPDARNDSRNYHLHVVAYDRPAKFIPEHNAWDFEVAETYNHKGQDRTRYPYRQAKIEGVTRKEKWMSDDEAAKAGQDFVPTLRREFARITNQVLKARGIRRTIDPRKYVEMGIDRTPTHHLGTKAAALEAIGVVTPVGLQNAVAIWADSERSIRRSAFEAGKQHRATQAEIEAIAKAATKTDPNSPALAQLRTLLVERDHIIRHVSEDREMIMTFDHLEAKAKSRAVRTRQTCLELLADIKNNKADATDSAMRRVIQDRWETAQRHIESIDLDLAPHRPALAAAAADIEKREARLCEIDQLLAPLRALLEQSAARALSTLSEAAKTKAETPAPKLQASASPSSEPRQPGRSSSPSTSAASAAKAPAEAPPAAPASLAPITIEGTPIVEPTIAPLTLKSNAPQPTIEGVPEGMSPVRPTPALDTAPAGASGEVSIDQPTPANAKTDVAATPPGIEPTQPASATTTRSPKQISNASVTPEPTKKDSPREKQEPSLLPLPEQSAPVEPNRSNVGYQEFDDLMNRIANQRIPITLVRDQNGTDTYQVPPLSDQEKRIIVDPRFADRATKRLAAIHKIQQQEIERLVRWIRTHGQDKKKLVLIDDNGNRRARLGNDVPKAVHTLFQHWKSAEEAVNAVRVEYGRRLEIEKAVEGAKAATADAKQPEVAAQAEQPSTNLPPIDSAKTLQVRNFLQLLQNNANPDRLRLAAQSIQTSAAARAEVNTLGVELATEFARHKPSTPPQLGGVGKRAGLER